MSEPLFFHADERVAVLTAEPLGRPLDYKAPEGGCVQGAFVEVPLGPRKVLGVVWGAGVGDYDMARLKPIRRLLDCAPMSLDMQMFLERVAEYTLTPLSAVLRLATRTPNLLDAPQMQYLYTRGTYQPKPLTAARTRVLEALKHAPPSGMSLQKLATAANVGTQVIKGLLKIGALERHPVPRDRPFARPDDVRRAANPLSQDQAKAANCLCRHLKTQSYRTFLLHGVTGSGKTEVYLEAIAACFAQGRQALVLLPEIALSAEFMERVTARFGVKAAEWHSGISPAERRRVWKTAGTGDAPLVVGARSALFLPFQHLGLIVVDEEHDTSYKQEESVFYNARDMAVLRASLLGAQVILASATPSLESWANAQQGKYTKLELKARFGAAQMPQMNAIDMRAEPLEHNSFISPSLRQQVQQRLVQGEQSLLFVNRRGYAPITLCRVCGHQMGCSQCDARLVEHRFMKRLVCHQCGADAPVPQSCPQCETQGKMANMGVGVEKLATEVQSLFPAARVAVLSSDMSSTAAALKRQIKSIADGNVDIIVGTQLVAKGHNFPHLTLVGVIDADLGLYGADLRASERMFQLMRQVAGRAGRTGKQGAAFLQTHQPDHPVIRAILSGDEQGFWRSEMAERAAAKVPPFGRMAGIILSSPDFQATQDMGLNMARAATPLTQIGAQVYGPAPAPIARIRGRHRMRLLIMAAKNAPLQPALTRWLAQFTPPKNMRIAVDIDPQSFY